MSDPNMTAGGYPADINNPDDWAAFLARYLDNRVTNAVHNGIGLVALHIVDAIRDARAQTAQKAQGDNLRERQEQASDTQPRRTALP